MPSQIVDKADWLKARLALLEEEKSLQRSRDRVARMRRALPWVQVETDYFFDSKDGRVSLEELFDGCRQLIVYHFMFHPDWDEGCKSCSFWADSFNGLQPHLRARDTRLVAVSRAPLDKLLGYRTRLGWDFPWVSSGDGPFNFDFNVSFTTEQLEQGKGNYNFQDGNAFAEELPGISVFCHEGDAVFHSYSTYARGLDPLNAAYQFLDLTAKGRDEDEFDMPMTWVRRHDQYAENRDRS